MELPELLARLREVDLLLDTDPKFPNVTALLAGETVRGSWWAHPKAHEMYRVASELRADPDVLAIKLVSGKITFIHRPLWMAVFAVGTRALADARALEGRFRTAPQIGSGGEPHVVGRCCART
jgi:hypothetical protein